MELCNSNCVSYVGNCLRFDMQKFTNKSALVRNKFYIIYEKFSFQGSQLIYRNG